MFFTKNWGSYRPFLPFSLPLSIQTTFTIIPGVIAGYGGFYYLIYTGLFFAAGLLLGCWKRLFSFKKTISLFILFCFAAGRTFIYINHRAHLFPLYNVTLEGSVESITYTDTKPWRYNAIISVSHIYTIDGWHKIPCTIQLYTHNAPAFSVADSIHCSIDQISQPTGDFVWYLYKEGIDATAFQRTITSHIINHPTYSLQRYIHEKRKKFHQALERKMNSATFALFSSLFLGNRTAIKQDLEEQKPLFKAWGISHFLARSGLHLLLFVMILEWLLKLIPLYFRMKQLILIALTMVYTLFSWSGISFIRALYTFLFYKAATLQALPFHSMYALGLVCSIILLYNPLQLFFLDFQLTFLLTFCLIWIAHTHHLRRLLYAQKIASKNQIVLQ